MAITRTTSESAENQSSIQKERRAESNRKLLEAAAVEFGAKGYSETKISDIAARAGLTQGLVTQRFQTKENLFLLVLNSEIEKCSKTLIVKAKELNPSANIISLVWSFSLKDSLLAIIHTIKEEAQNGSSTFDFACEMVNPKDVPESAKEIVRKSLRGVVGKIFINQIAKGSKENKIMKGDPESLIVMFVRSCLSLTRCCMETGLEMPGDDMYLRLIGYKTTEISAEDQRRAVAASLSNDFDYVVYIDMKTQEVTRFFATPLFAQEVIKNDEIIGKDLPTAYRLNYLLKRIIVPESIPPALPRFNDINVFLNYMSVNKSFKFQAQLNVGPKKNWYRFKFVIDEKNPDGIVFGIVNVHNQLMFAYEKGESNAKLINEDFYQKAILNNAYSYFRVNLSRNRVISPIMERVDGEAKDYTEKFCSNDSVMPKYDQIIKEAAEKYVDEEFKKSYEVNLSSDYLISQYQSGKTMTEFLCKIYSTILGWHYRKYVSYITKDITNDEIHAMIVAYNVTSDVSAKMEREHAQSIIAALAKEYTGLYYVNLEDFSAELFSMSNRIESDTGKLVRNADFTVKKGNFAPIYQIFVKNSVHPDDQKMMMGILEDVKTRLVGTKSFSVMFRRNYDGEYLYTEMTVIKVEGVDEEPRHVILGFMEKDAIYRSQKESERINEVMAALSHEYSCVFFYDMEKDQATPYLLNERIARKLQEKWENVSYKEATNMYVERAVAEHCKERLRKNLSLPHVLAMLEDQESYSIEYMNDEDRYCEFKVTFAGIDGNSLVLGFADKDELIRGRKEKEAEIQRNYQIIQTLASEYSSVYYVQVKDGILVPYSIDKRTEKDFGPLLKEGIEYSKAFRIYVSEYVYENDKELVLKACSYDNVLKELGKRKRFDVVCRRVIGGVINYSKVSYVKLEGEGQSPSAFSVAFDYNDAHVIDEFINRKLTQEFSSIMMADLDNGIIRTYKRPGAEETNGTYIIEPYGEGAKVLATQVAAEYRQMWENFSHPEFVKEFLMDTDMREFVYQIPGNETPWRRSIWQVVDRKDGVPSTIVATFTGIDNITADKMMLDTKVVNTLAQRYENIYCIDLDKDQFLLTEIKKSDNNPYTEMLLKGASYTELATHSLNHYIAPSYRSVLEKTCSLEFLREEFKKHDSFSYTFLSLFNGIEHYRDMLFTKLNDDSGSFRFIWAFADVHERVMGEQRHEQELKAKNEELERMNEDIIELLGNLVEGRDLESGEHVKRVKIFSKILAKQVQKDMPQYGLTDEDIDLISSASALHDVGKIMIPDAVLLKPGKLTEGEFALMKTHCVKGCEILAKAPSDWSKDYLKMSMDICRWHHEKYDGSGYPDGLKGDDIPISAQIVSIADCFDALVTKRVYKDAFPCMKAIEMIKNGECGVFSEGMMNCFLKCTDEILKEYENVTGSMEALK